MTFDEFFRRTWPKHWATLKMYDDGSTAVDAIDCIVPRRIQLVAEKAWNAREAEINRLEIALRIKTEEHDCAAGDVVDLRILVGKCYEKLLNFGVESSDPFLMDEREGE